MLKIALAGLVMNNVITLKKAEHIAKELAHQKIPETVSGVIKAIESCQ